MGRSKRVKRDRAAGMVFDWRSGHGATYRFLIAILVSGAFWGALLTWVQIGEAKPGPLNDRQIDLTVIDLDQKSNRWIANLIDRETLFHERWDVSKSSVLDQEISRALALDPIRSYSPQLREIPLPSPNMEIDFLPEWGRRFFRRSKRSRPRNLPHPL